MKPVLLKIAGWIFLPSENRNEPEENVRLATILNGANFLAMLLLLVVGYYIFYRSQYIVFGFNAIIFIVLSVNFTLYKISHSIKLYMIITTSGAILFGLFNFMYGGFSNLGHLWSLIMPMLFYIFTGYRWGTVIATLYLMIFNLFFLMNKCFISSMPCTPDFIFTFSLIYCFIAALSFILEFSRHKAQGNYNKLIENLDLLSRTDELTGLLNRRGILEYLKYEFRKFLRNEAGFVISICDIDHFKSVNDTYGHDSGDGVLREMSRFIKQQLRAGDFISRWGGEEFIILMRDTSAAEGTLILERIRHFIEMKRFKVRDVEIQVTVSFGISETSEASTLEALIDIADKRLYTAKEQGRNRVVNS